MPVPTPPRKVRKAALESKWLLEGVVDGPRIQVVNGKTKKYYKVKWCDSYEPEENIPSIMIDLYENRTERTIKVLGPVEEEDKQFLETFESNGRDSVLKDSTNTRQVNARQKLVITDQTLFAVEVDSDVSIMPYKEVKATYKNHLLEFYESRILLKQSEVLKTNSDGH